MIEFKCDCKTKELYICADGGTKNILAELAITVDEIANGIKKNSKVSKEQIIEMVFDAIKAINDNPPCDKDARTGGLKNIRNMP